MVGSLRDAFLQQTLSQIFTGEIEMSVLVTKPAPNFKAKAVLKDGSVAEISLSQFKGKYVLLFFYPLDFTFVCPTEIISFSDRVKEFTDLDVEVIGVSVDSEYSHLAWRNTARKDGGIGQVDYSLVADLNKQIVATTNPASMTQMPDPTVARANSLPARVSIFEDPRACTP